MTYRDAIDRLLDVVTEKAVTALCLGTEAALADRLHAERCYKAMIFHMRKLKASPEDAVPPECKDPMEHALIIALIIDEQSSRKLPFRR